jgi:dTDP-4-dehydrorhamnose reductase
VHFSTDYVFSGTGTRPYREEDEAVPGTIYGRSKLAGDQAILASRTAAYIFRIAWVYGRRRRNFLTTIEKQTSERDVLRVVNDQYGSPTWSRVVAEAAALAVGQWLTARRDRREPPPAGVYHMAAPDHTTWHAFASAIVDALPLAVGRARPVVMPISTAEYPMAARRPAWSVLDSGRLREVFGLALPSWQEQLALCYDLHSSVARSGATAFV